MVVMNMSLLSRCSRFRRPLWWGLVSLSLSVQLALLFPAAAAAVQSWLCFSEGTGRPAPVLFQSYSIIAMLG